MRILFVLFGTLFSLLILSCSGCPTGNETIDPVSLCFNGVFDEDKGEEAVDCGGACDPCHPVSSFKELLIKETFVVDSPDAQTGELSFGHLIKNMAPTEAQAKDLVLSLLTSWESTPSVNGKIIPSRPNIRSLVIDPWKSADGAAGESDANWNMNLDNMPARLLAIINRIDLKRDQGGSIISAGEGRFTYGITVGNQQFTWIFEYELPASTIEEVRIWGNRWHRLGLISDNAIYLDSLKQVVNHFTKRGAMPSAINGSAISQIRTNEIALLSPWELREFRLRASDGMFEEVTRKQTPDMSLDNSALLEQFVITHADDIIDGFTYPESFNSQEFLAGNCLTPSPSFTWRTPNPLTGQNLIALQDLSEKSCNGCHGGSTNTVFTHIKPRSPGQESLISNFLDTDLIRRADTVRSLLLLPQPLAADFQFSIIDSTSEMRSNRQKMKNMIDRLSVKGRVH